LLIQSCLNIKNSFLTLTLAQELALPQAGVFLFFMHFFPSFFAFHLLFIGAQVSQPFIAFLEDLRQ